MKKLRFIVLIALLFFVYPLFASEYYGRNVMDSSKIRKTIIKKWFDQDLDHLRLLKPEVYLNDLGQEFQVRLEELEDSFAVVVAPKEQLEIEIINGTEKKEITMDIYSYNRAGSWILFRSKKNGEPTGVRWYFHKDPGMYIEFNTHEYSDKCYADFVLYDYYLVRSMPVGLELHQLYDLSFVDMVELTSASIPWKYAEIENYLYEDTLQMIAAIREKMEKITYSIDSCYDADMKPINVSDGQPRVEIAEGGISLDSFGFAKWIVDGLVCPLTGKNLEYKSLKNPTKIPKSGSKADSFNERYDMYGALNWTRNLAAAYLSVISIEAYTYKNSGCEVTSRPFANFYTPDGIKSIPSYIKDSGYATECLKALFYVFAIDEPGRFYLGAVRETDDSIPQNVFYSRTVVFFPYFDSNDDFNVSVFENDKECTIEEFIENNPGTFVNLVRLQSSQRFFPQPE